MNKINKQNFILPLTATAIVLFTLMSKGGFFSKMSETISDKNAGLNGDFEVVRSELPVNWILYTPRTVPRSDFDLEIDTTEFKSGKQSLKYVVRACTGKSGWRSPGFCRELDLVPGKTYDISFWYRLESAEFSFVAGGVSDKKGEYGQKNMSLKQPSYGSK